ncbi:hypothetical protein DCAR_0417962 [Daucus carota subsp. sativus]|uniref:Exonuclease domain-containing protein n=2 Tax=Daucus carota subsp. sativus TaxID=79200 RepID=A0AAF0X1H6_DAUCS|nr:PREDICTED: uncharacterized exonuclease domain-containing protein At3g15140-like [Daucus carota subsp. sativus]WOG98618.1 hypothetical protein DCAR_0417962 [Daucus carota subsp. sativus]
MEKTTQSKSVCLYFTQGRCNKMKDKNHLKAYSHGFPDLDTESFDLKNVQPQQFDFFLVLDLEGSVSILEFPVLMIDAKTLKHVDFFHRFVRPTDIEMGEERKKEYVEQHYGQFGMSRVWHETAIPFKKVIQQFEDWLSTHQVWANKSGGHLNKGAFITCGNWDIKTKIPEQYKVAGMQLPPYFMEWINLKDVYLNFYKKKATGMVPMMKLLQMPLVGNHHLGIDDTTNIARVLQHLIIDGSVLQITGRRNSDGNVDFLFKNRIQNNYRQFSKRPRTMN